MITWLTVMTQITVTEVSALAPTGASPPTRPPAAEPVAAVALVAVEVSTSIDPLKPYLATGELTAQPQAVAQPITATLTTGTLRISFRKPFRVSSCTPPRDSGLITFAVVLRSKLLSHGAPPRALPSSRTSRPVRPLPRPSRRMLRLRTPRLCPRSRRSRPCLSTPSTPRGRRTGPP